MKKIFLILILLFAITCKSQVVSLEEAAQCIANPSCPDYNYSKDINNSLQKYVGTWKGSHNGTTYEMKFVKGFWEDLGMKSDDLKGRIRITNPSSNGFPSLIIFDNFNESDDSKTSFFGLGFQPDLQAYRMYFNGSSPQGCINYGKVFLRINPNAPNQMTIFYWSDMDIVVGDCPPTFQQTFPEKQVINLTKQ